MKPSTAPLRTHVLLLEGGHRLDLPLRDDDPLLQQLTTLIAQPANQRPLGLISLPLADAPRHLNLPPQALVGLISDGALPAVTAALAQQAGNTPAVEPAVVVQWTDFLPPEDHAALVAHAIEHQAAFRPSGVSTQDEKYRESWVLSDFPRFAQLMEQRIRERLSLLLPSFGLAPDLELPRFESQLTAHNDGNYYRQHNDNGSPDTASRLLTYVYYFNRSPKAYDGGQLRVWDSTVRDGYYVAAESAHDYQPLDNSIVFFLSRYLHEVLPVRCPSGQFADSRFTINGWLHQTP